MRIAREILSYILIVIIIVIFRTYIMTPAQVNRSSMEPTLIDREIVLLNKIKYRITDIERFDIVVVKVANYGSLVKRVIGLPGEKVEYIHGHLYIIISQ